eukprot:SAG31_NODE_4416_length_3252_cov_5.682207_1_plen_89_part_10
MILVLVESTLEDRMLTRGDYQPKLQSTTDGRNCLAIAVARLNRFIVALIFSSLDKATCVLSGAPAGLNWLWYPFESIPGRLSTRVQQLN